MRYVFRRLESGCWLDTWEFHSDTELKVSDIPDALARGIECGGIRAYCPMVLCLIQRLNNGRERRVGRMDILLGRGGALLNADDFKPV